MRYGLNQPGAGLDPAKVTTAYAGSPLTVRMATVREILLGILIILVALGRDSDAQEFPSNPHLLVMQAS